MKIYSTLAILALVILTESSCKKDPSPVNPFPPRTIKFILHTEADLSKDNHNITFSVFIRTHTKTLFDSTLTTIKIKDIPDSTHQLVIEKKVPNDDGSDLAVGFNYAIENVGNSWYIDTCSKVETLKVVDYSFR